MSPIVLTVAGIFVIAGITLIILSIMVGRSRPAEDDFYVSETLFIDEPLETSLAAQLDGLEEEAPAAESAVALSESDEPTAESTVTLDGSDEPTGVLEVPAGAVALAGPAPAGYGFRVQLGFKFLEREMYQDAAEEFLKAAGLTDDMEAKLGLYVEIGNAFRRQGMNRPAVAAYTQADKYAGSELLREHLQRTIAEMETNEAGTVAAAPSAQSLQGG